jgi:ABC-type nickel/cobalt efflux system permease component RcnA
MAAYLVGQRGSFRQAAVIAATVTATHTTGVLVLGIVLSASTSLASERIYPVLGAVSGVMLAAIGLSLLRRALRARAHGHHHLGGDDAQPLGMKAVAGMGFAGGLVPSPSAVVVLLGASALHRVWLGIVLVVAYGLGMALTLSGAGLVLVRARAWLERRSHRDGSELLMRFARAVPIVTASIIMTVGTVLAARGATRI